MIVPAIITATKVVPILVKVAKVGPSLLPLACYVTEKAQEKRTATESHTSHSRKS